MAVPSGVRTSEPVADELFVETGLHRPFAVGVGRPVARRVRSQHLIGEHQVPVAIDAELELGVGQYHALAQRVLGGLAIGRQGELSQLLRARRAHQVDDAIEGDVLVVRAEVCLGRRGEQRVVEPAGFGQPGRQVDATHRSGGPVVDQPGTGEVAACDAFHRNHVQCPDHQCAAEYLGGDAGVLRRAGEVIRGVQQTEEEDAHRREDAALVRDGGLEDVVVGRDPVGRHKQQVVIVDAVDLPNLAAGQVAVIGQGGAHRVRLSAAGAGTVLGSRP